MDNDLTSELRARVLDAYERRAGLEIRGSGSKRFLGRTAAGERLDVAGHRGIVNYQPKELVVTARCGTTLEKLEAELLGQRQMLPFEPPRFGPAATVGGTIACGLSGPARAYQGAARDMVLGTRVLTGRGEVLRFGGEVMKNVAGYDVSRLITGSFGTLGVLLEVSLKVLPLPAASRTLAQERTAAEAIEAMSRLAGKPLPVTATCWDGERLYVRLAGAEQGVRQAAAGVGGEPVEDAEVFWRDEVREQGHGFFAGDRPLWRLSVPQAAPPLALPGRQLVEWGGAQRWLRSDADPAAIWAAAAAAGGHATLFRGGDRAGEVSQPLPAAVMGLHRNLKRAFDPAGVLNPGRLYRDL
jgi:glycolate oxidase FAD binding subunit